jgi:TRAP-type C4-dicarboxylate transport system permease small subunit
MNNKFLTQRLTISGYPIEGPLEGINNIGDLINRLLPFFIGIAGIILLFVFIWGGYDLIMSQGDANKIKSAQAKITTGLIGFILLILSYLITSLIARIFGLGGGFF